MFNYAGYAILVVYSIFLFYRIYCVTDLLTDADISSNMLYGKLLLDNKSLLLNNWYYSTFVDLINIDKAYGFFFIFTDDWQLVHTLGIMLVYILLLLSFFYVSSRLRLKYTPWISLMIVGALSYDYYRYVVYFNIYAVYIIFTFLVIGLVLDVLNSEKRIHKLILLGIVSFLSCTSGIRNITTIFLPLVAALIVMILAAKIKFYRFSEKNIKLLMLSIGVAFVFSVLGYIFNGYISSIVGFTNYSVGLTSEPLKMFFTLFFDVLFKGWVGLFGVDGISVRSLIGLLFMVPTVFFSFYSLLKNRSDFVANFIILFFIFSTCATSVVFFISTTNFEPRYLLQPFSVCFLIYGLFLNNWDYKQIVVSLVVIALFSAVSTFVYIDNEVKDSENGDLISFAEILNDKNISEGYASYWNANILSEFSDGKIEVWSFWLENRLENLSSEEVSENGIDGKYLNEWLQLKSHMNSKPEEPFFMVLNNRFQSMFTDEFDKYVVYEGKTRKLLIFDTYYDFADILP